MPEPRPPVRSVLDLIGNTPLVPLQRVGAELPYRLFAKLEYLNPGGSVKDRIGPEMVDAAERDGRLRPGGTIVEATSGNTGVGLALVAAVRGYRMVFVLPDKMSSEKIRLLKAFGARVVVTPSGVPPEHPMSHYSVAARLARETPGAFYPDQYSNPANPGAHYRTTGPEIERDAGPGLAAVIGTVGTGGTMSGIGRYFKEHRPDVRIVGVDPRGSVLAPYFRTHTVPPAVPYLVEGIGEDMVPRTVDFGVFDAFVDVGDAESFAAARRLVREEGLFVGGSSGSAVAGAIRWLSDRPLPDGASVVIVLPDSGDRYLSKFYSDDWLRENGLLGAAATARDVLAGKAEVPALVAVEPTTNVRVALELLRRHHIAEMPVLDGGRNLGTFREEVVLRRSFDDGTVLDRTARAVLSPPLPEAVAGTPVAELIRRLREEPVILVRERPDGAPIGVLTRHDLVGRGSEERHSHAV